MSCCRTLLVMVRSYQILTASCRPWITWLNLYYSFLYYIFYPVIPYTWYIPIQYNTLNQILARWKDFQRLEIILYSTKFFFRAGKKTNHKINSVLTNHLKDKLVKITLDSRKLNESCVERKTTMPHVEDLISKISAEVTKNDGEVWMPEIGLDYAYVQAKLSEEASRHCVSSVIGGDFTGHYRFKRASTDSQSSPRSSKNILM